MKIFAYSYTEPLLEAIPDKTIWGWEVDRVYQDLGKRAELKQLLGDCEGEPPDYLLIRRVEELGESVEEICDRLVQLESFGIELVPLESQLTIIKDDIEDIIEANGEEAIADSGKLRPKSVTRTDILKLFQDLQENQRSR